MVALIYVHVRFSNTFLFFADKIPTLPIEDVKPSFSSDSISPGDYPAHSPFVASAPVLHPGAGQPFPHRTLPTNVSTLYAPCSSTLSNGDVDVSCVKQEPGFHSNFPADPTRRTVSMDSPYPFHIKKELNPLYMHDQVRRQTSMPLNPNLQAPINLENRRSSAPAVTPKPFPRSHPYPSPITSGAPPLSYPGTPNQLACQSNQLDAQQRHDLYLVNLATYHHHQELETIKRRKITTGMLVECL